MAERTRLVGINHVALEVSDVDAAVDFYGSIFSFELRGRSPGGAFLDMGDQFLALTRASEESAPDAHRHFGLVVEDKEAARAALRAAGFDVRGSGSLRFRDPWGNTVEVVGYRDVQFTKAPAVLSGMGLDGLEKSESARDELAGKGLAG
jgi:catechol 2,3-dioxygenase-like lactoylglutathione lyase family enzyme